jgi:2-iminobutanoate/2-iminopropanoate deaminase
MSSGITYKAPSFNPKAPFSATTVFSTAKIISLSGNVALDLATGKFMGGTVAEETERILKNIDSILKAEGSGLNNVFDATCFLVSEETYAEFNSAYIKCFAEGQLPTRTTVGVSWLPLGAKVEIKVLAVAGS